MTTKTQLPFTLVCKKCGSTKITFVLIVDDSYEPEPSILRIECRQCGNKFISQWDPVEVKQDDQ